MIQLNPQLLDFFVEVLDLLLIGLLFSSFIIYHTLVQVLVCLLGFSNVIWDIHSEKKFLSQFVQVLLVLGVYHLHLLLLLFEQHLHPLDLTLQLGYQLFGSYLFLDDRGCFAQEQLQELPQHIHILV